MIFSALGSILVQTTTGDVQKYMLLISPLDVLDGAVYWLFAARPPADSVLADAGSGRRLATSLRQSPTPRVSLAFLLPAFSEAGGLMAESQDAPVPAVRVASVSRWYGNVVAVNDISFDLGAGHYGPAGA